MVSALKLGQLLSLEPGEYKNLSIFLCLKRAFVFSHEKALTMSLQQSEEKGIGIKEIRELANQEMCFPETNKDFRTVESVVFHSPYKYL